MPDGGNADGLLTIGQLVEDPIRADAQRVQPTQFASQCIAGMRFTLQEAQRILNRVD